MQRTKGFTLIELLVVVGIIALLISILLPSLGRARELSKRTACQANAKSIGTACFIYQEDNLGVFPTAPHLIHNEADPQVSYMGTMGGDGSVDRDEETIAASSNDNGTSDVAVSRSLWLLVRTGEVVPKNFICPSSEDTADPTVDVTTYYDFIGFGALSYGFQIPYDSANAAKPSVDTDPRMALLADRGPWSIRGTWEDTIDPIDPAAGYAPDSSHPSAVMSALWSADGGLMDPDGGAPGYRTDRSPPEVWLPFNSPNHGGQQQGEGQSVLYPDIHVEFRSRPTASTDGDNIYTQMGGGYDDFQLSLFWGVMPPAGVTNDGSFGVNYYPGDESLAPTLDSTTDTLVWP